MSDAQPISAAHNGTAQASRQTAFGRSSMALACPMDRSPPTHSEPERPRKRLRTRKACAYCKARKIRCDFDGSSRPGDPCKRCQTYGLACDVVCEVDHPRGRPASPEESRSSTSPRSRSTDSLLSHHGPTDTDDRDNAAWAAMPSAHDARPLRPRSRSGGLSPPPTTLPAAISAGMGQVNKAQLVGLPLHSGLRQLLEDRISGSHFYRPDPRLLGSTSLASLLTPVARDGAQSGQVFNHDMRFGVRRRDAVQEEASVIWSLNATSPVWRLPDHRLERPIIEKLLDLYACRIAPLFPVLYPNEARNIRSLSVFQIMAMCTVASLSRSVPRTVCCAFRSRLHHLLEAVPGGNIWTSNQTNLSALLIISMNSELHGRTESAGASIAWLRSGVAVRMGQDLGLHRKVHDFGVSTAQQRIRSRLWAMCMVVDAWYAVSYGQPLMVDATSVDCEPFVPGPDGSTEIGKADLLVAALFSLTVLLRKILRSVYDVTRGPLGAVSDPALLETAVELEHWSETLPDPLRSHTQIPPSNTGAALIALMGDAVKYIFLRPFRYRVNVPSHVTYTVPDATWSKLIAHSHLTIAWFAAHGACMIDTWFVVAYCLAYCAQLHFYNYLDTHDEASLHTLLSCSEILDSWTSAQGDTYEATSLRYRVTDIVSQLYQAAVDGCMDTRVSLSKAQSMHLFNPSVLGFPPQAVLDPAGDMIPDGTMGDVFGDLGQGHHPSAGVMNVNDDWSTLLNSMGIIFDNPDKF